MDNIIKFPKKLDNEFLPLTLEDSYEHIESVRREYCDEISSDMMEAAFTVLASYGVTVKPDEKNVKLIVFLEEAIKSIVYSTKRLPHSFQEIAENVVTLTPQACNELKELMSEEKQLIT